MPKTEELKPPPPAYGRPAKWQDKNTYIEISLLQSQKAQNITTRSLNYFSLVIYCCAFFPMLHYGHTQLRRWYYFWKRTFMFRCILRKYLPTYLDISRKDWMQIQKEFYPIVAHLTVIFIVTHLSVSMINCVLPLKR